MVLLKLARPVFYSYLRYAATRILLWANQLRVAHWGKNCLVFLPLICCGRGFSLVEAIRVFITFLLFGALSSGVYLINDLLDYASDRLHPLKKSRPLASGKVKWISVLWFAVILVTISISAGFILNRVVFLVFCAYLFNTTAYSCLFRRIPVVDVISIAVGFVLRFAAGTAIINCRMNPMFFLFIFIFCLFFTLIKRRIEVGLLQAYCIEPCLVREAFKGYNQTILNRVLPITAVTCVLTYSVFAFGFFILYPVTSGYLFLSTVPLVLYAFLKYPLIIICGEKSGLLSSIFKHKEMLAVAMAWVFLIGLIVMQQILKKSAL